MRGGTGARAGTGVRGDGIGIGVDARGGEGVRTGTGVRVGGAGGAVRLAINFLYRAIADNVIFPF